MYELVSFSLAVPLVFIIVFNCWKQTKKTVSNAANQFNQQGYVVDFVNIRPIGKVTRIWGQFEKPIPLYVQVSNVDPGGVIAGNFGIADIPVGDEIFDLEFIVRTNCKEKIAQIVSKDFREKFLSYKHIRYRTGSIETFLPLDYFPERKTGRNIREFWIIEAGGVLDNHQIQDLLAFAQALNSKINILSRSYVNNSNYPLETGFFEGR